MKQRAALLGTSAGVWAEKRPEDSLVNRMLASQAARMAMGAGALVKGDTVTVPLDELLEAGGDILRCPSLYNQAGGAEQARE